MSSALALLAATTLGVNYGWRELPEDGYEYVIRIEPEMLDEVRGGRDITSYLPPSYREAMHRIRIVVGTEPLPHEGEPPPTLRATVPADPASSPEPVPEGSVPPSAHAAMHAPPAAVEDEPEAPVLTDAATGEPAGGQPATVVAEGAAAESGDHTQESDAATDAPVGPERHSTNYPPDESTAPPTPDAGSSPQNALSPASRLDRAQWLYYGGLFGLAASLAANVYLVWVAVHQRGRYRTLAADLQGA